MNRSELILVGLAASSSATYSPVQVQKLLFLLDRHLTDVTGGALFHFEPYHYGPFDKDVYTELERMEEQGLVEIARDVERARRQYRLTSTGQARGDELLAAIPPTLSKYAKEVSNFVRSTSFAELVSAIYRSFPDMKAKSIFSS